MSRECETLSVPEAGRVLGISRDSAYQAAKTGELPIIKIGRLIRVPRPALDEMLRRSSQPAAA